METALIKGGTVYDGTGGKPYAADVLLRDGTIAAVEPGGIAGADVAPFAITDATGLAVAPGFIDAHSHSEWIVPEPGHADILRPLLLQGITTFLGGNCGFSPFPVTDNDKDMVLENSRFLTNERFTFRWREQREYFDYVAKNGSCLNMATLAGHGPMRTRIKGNRPDVLSGAELARLGGLLESALADGAYGLSLGLSYVPGIFADAKEIETVFAAAALAGRPVAIHGRTYSRTSPFFPNDASGAPHNFLDMASFIAVAARTGAKLHVSHLLLKGSNSWDLWRDALGLFDKAKANGVDVTFGVIPYHCGNTLITTLFPKWFLKDFAGNIARSDQVKKLEAEVSETEKAIGRGFSDLFLLWGVNPALASLQGKSFSAIAEEMGVTEIEACLYIAKESEGRAKVLTAAYSGKEGTYPEPLERLLAHPLSLVEIDAILTASDGPQIPASFGAFPKWLGHYSRDRGLMPMEQAVRRITGSVVDRFGIKMRGYLRPGYAADVTIFDPATIKDTNSIAKPSHPPVGVIGVFVNGRLVVRNGELCGKSLHGKVL